MVSGFQDKTMEMGMTEMMEMVEEPLLEVAS
jgi:hypothetical protein